MGDTVTLERADGIGVVTLDRPERLNAISVELIEDFHAVLDDLDRDLATRVVVLTGAGRGFCSGTDLKEGVDVWPEPVGKVQARYRLQQRLARVVVRMREIPQPLVAAVHGPAAGGGLVFAAACDLRVADETARFNAAFIRIGLSAGDVGASWFLPRLLGPAMAAELMYTGRFVDADEARRIGLVSRVTPPGDDVAAARAFAEEILQNSPLGVRMTKELLNLSLDAPALRQMLELENRTQILSTFTADFEEGTAAFADRRPANYTDS